MLTSKKNAPGLWTAVFPLALVVGSCGAKQADTDLIADEPSEIEADSGAPQAPKARPVARGPLTFGWPVPCQVSVTERAVKKGDNVTSRFVLSVVRAENSDDLIVRFGRPEYLEIDGQKPEPETNTAHALTIAMAAALPTPPDMVISKQGLFKRFARFDMEKYVNEMLNTVDLERHMSKKEADKVRKMYCSPEFIKAMYDKTAEKWRVWVEAWIGLKIAEGQDQRGEIPIALNQSTSITAKLTLRNLGPVEDNGELLRLQLLVEQKDPRLAELLVAFMRQVAGSDQTSVDALAQSLAAVEKYSSVHAEIDPKNLKPQKITAIDATLLIMKNGKTDLNEDQREYTFDWSIK